MSGNNNKLYGDELAAILEDSKISVVNIAEKSQQEKEEVSMPDSVSRKNEIIARLTQIRRRWQDTDLDYNEEKNNQSLVCAMKRIGISHMQKDMPCQDSFKIMTTEGKFELVTVADGHSSNIHDLSEFGSQLACESVCEIVNSIVTDRDIGQALKYFRDIEFKFDIVKKWQDKVREHFKKTVNRDGDKPEKVYTRYGTTIMFALHFAGKIIVGKLGDGGIILSKNNKTFKILFKENKIGTSTASLCMDDSYMLMNINIYNDSDFTTVMLMTDGIYDLFENDIYLEKNMSRFTEKLDLDSHEKSLEFKELFNEFVEFNKDDVTVGLMQFKSKTSLPIAGVLDGRKMYIVDKIEYRECTIKIECHCEEEKYIAVLSKYFQLHKETKSDSNSIFIMPCDEFIAGEYVCYIYNCNTAIGISSLYDLYIIDKSTKIPDDIMLKVLNALLKSYDEISRHPFENKELFYEMLGFSLEEEQLLIPDYCEKSVKKNQGTDIFPELMADCLSGWYCSVENIVTDSNKTAVRFAPSDSAVTRNLNRIPPYYLEKILHKKAHDVIDKLAHCISAICKTCGESLIVYNGISYCPHCKSSVVAKAVYKVQGSGHTGVLCTNTIIDYKNLGIEEKGHCIELMYNQSNGDLGIKTINNADCKINWNAISPSKTEKLSDGDILSILERSIEIKLIR